MTDGSYDRGYPGNSLCKWQISVKNASPFAPITVDFSLMTIEMNYDFVNIYDGPSDESPLLASFSGEHSGVTITTSGPHMYIKLITDTQITADGFFGHYKTALCAQGLSLVRGQGGIAQGPAHSFMKNYEKILSSQNGISNQDNLHSYEDSCKVLIFQLEFNLKVDHHFIGGNQSHRVLFTKNFHRSTRRQINFN